MAEWVRVTEGDGLNEAELRRVAIGERWIVLTRNEGRLYAFHAACPHASADLRGGDLHPTYIICPLHSYRFDLRTGRCLKPPDGPRLRIFPVEERANGVWVEV